MEISDLRTQPDRAALLALNNTSAQETVPARRSQGDQRALPEDVPQARLLGRQARRARLCRVALVSTAVWRRNELIILSQSKRRRLDPSLRGEFKQRPIAMVARRFSQPVRF